MISVRFCEGLATDMKIEEKNKVLAAIHRVDEQNVLPGTCTISGQIHSYYFIFDQAGITVIRLVYGSVDQVDQCNTFSWRDIQGFRIKSGLLTNQLIFESQGRKYSYMLNKSVAGNLWVKENRLHLQSVDYYYSEDSTTEPEVVPEPEVSESEIDESTGLDFASCLNRMRMNYLEHPMTGRELHKPLWLRKQDALIQIFQDSDLLFASGKIYYGCLVQANSLLFGLRDKNDYPATFIYSTDPYFEEHPKELRDIAQTLYDAKEASPDSLSSPLREMAAILNAESDRSQIEFSASIGETEKIVRLCSTLVFRQDLPENFLRGSIFPMIALPEQSNAVMILPKEYWTEDFTQAKFESVFE